MTTHQGRGIVRRFSLDHRLEQFFLKRGLKRELTFSVDIGRFYLVVENPLKIIEKLDLELFKNVEATQTLFLADGVLPRKVGLLRRWPPHMEPLKE
jgi:predicted DNA-binding transcriptional regulator